MATDTAAAEPLRRRGASMADVARIAGVSGQTVSRVANGARNVDAATRERVLAAMREVGYRPNSAARALRSGQFQQHRRDRVRALQRRQRPAPSTRSPPRPPRPATP